MKYSWRYPLQFALGVGMLAGIVLSGSQAQAASKITMIIGPLNRSITLAELETLANKNESAGDLKTVLGIAKQSNEQAGKFLQQEFPFGLIQADRLLNSQAGVALLDRISKIIAPRTSNKMGTQALRSAIILSLADDGKMTPLELVRKYPTEVRVNIDELLKASKEFKDIPSLIQGFGGLGGR